jgi:hypothetical protein
MSETSHGLTTFLGYLNYEPKSDPQSNYNNSIPQIQSSPTLFSSGFRIVRLKVKLWPITGDGYVSELF